MFKNYVKIAIRSLVHHKLYTGINLLGLAVGLSVFFFLLVYVMEERSFDRFHTNYDRTYRIIEEATHPDLGKVWSGASAPPMAEYLERNFPNVTYASTATQFGQSVMTIDQTAIGGTERTYNERDYLITNDAFFNVFDFHHIAGDPLTGSLVQPGQVVLTEASAFKYFGEIPQIGEQISNNRFGNLTISAVIEDPPENSHLAFDFLISLATIRASERGNSFLNAWDQSAMATYIVMDQPIDPASFESHFRKLETEVLGDNLMKRKFHLQPLSAIHFESSEIINELSSTEASKRNPLYLRIFIWIGLLVLLIASFNYVNLATARAMTRAKEIGVRKMSGASDRQLFYHILFESILTTLVAGLVGFLIVLLTLPYFNYILNTQFNFSDFANASFFLPSLLTLLVVGLLAGVLPAWILSRSSALNSFRGIVGKKMSYQHLRNSLVIFQFAITIGVIASTVVVYQQLQYIQNKDLGFNDEHLVVIDINSGTARNSFQRFKQAFLKHPTVINTAATSRVPGEWKQIAQIGLQSSQNEDATLTCDFFAMDQDALSALGLQLVSGRNFSGQISVDTNHILINQTAADQLGLDHIVGDQVKMEGSSRLFTIIGVVRDFHVRSLHQVVRPTVIGSWSNPVQSIDYFACRITGDDIPATLAHFKSVMDELDPDTPLEYHFLDSQLDRFYQEDIRISRIFLGAAILALIIACLGLFGLVTFTIGQRIKEVGVRKILGASSIQLWKLLARNIIILIGVAFIIASPLSWLFMNDWLADFEYRIAISALTYLFVGGIVLLVGLASIHYHLRRVILLDPVVSLKEL